MESGSLRCGQASCSAAYEPSDRRKMATRSPATVAANGRSPISRSHAAAYQALRTNMGCIVRMSENGPMSELDGRVVLVTGGGRGIGRGISELLAAHGATVAVNYRSDADAAADTVAGHHGCRGLGEGLRASVDDADQCAAMVQSVIADFGGIDVLVCNAGIASRGRSSPTPIRPR